MRFFAICDNLDARMGLRLAGMDCALVSDREQFDIVFGEALEDKDIGILVLTEQAQAMNPDRVFEARMSRKSPLIVSVPGAVGDRPVGEDLLGFIGEAIGVKL